MSKILLSRNEIKQRAKKFYSQNFRFVLAAFFSFLPSTIFTVFASLKLDNAPKEITFIISFFVALLFHPLVLGLYYLLFQGLNSQRESFKELLHFYSPASFIKAIGLYLITKALPMTILSTGLFISHLFISNTVLMILLIVFTVLISTICSIISFIFWSLSEYLMAGYAHLSILQTLQTSFRLIRGNCKALLALYCSFVPWFLIVIFLSQLVYNGSSFQLPTSIILVVSCLLLLLRSAFSPYYHLTIIIFTNQLLRKVYHKKAFTVKYKATKKYDSSMAQKNKINDDEKTDQPERIPSVVSNSEK